MQVRHKELIFHLQQIAVHRRIQEFRDKTEDICNNINNKNKILWQLK